MKRRYPKAVQLPSGSYRCQVMVGGKRVSVTADSPVEAISKAVALREGIKKDPQDLTLGEVIDEYIEARERVLSPSTVKAYRSYRRTRFPAYMERRISELDRRTIQRMVNEEARKIKPKALKNAFALVAAALKDYDMAVPDVNLPAIPAAERPWLSSDEVLRFCRVVQGEPCEIPALLALCSLRLSEIAALTWEDVDLKAGTVRVRRSVVSGETGLVEKQTNKTASSTRTVPIIIPQLKTALQAVPEKSGRVMKMHPNTLHKQVNRICALNGLPQVGAHGLRHSFASLCHFLKVPELEAARIGGWSDLSTMRKIYTHLSDRQIGDAAATLSRFFG